MKPTTEADTVILGVIRGDVPLSALRKLGIEVHCENGSCRLTSEAMPSVVTPSVFDIASGLLKYAGRPKELSLWAFFVLAESGGVDLAQIESHVHGDLLISTLWDASHEGRISQDAIKVAENLAKVQHSIE